MAKSKVIFLCTGNSARSQMAEAYLRHYAGAEYEVHSAGLEARGIHPLTVKVMAEVGIDLSNQHSKTYETYGGRTFFDDAIIVCRRFEEKCPSVTADAQRIHRWIFDDPATAEGSDEAKLAKFREVRDQIDRRITMWLQERQEARPLDDTTG